MPQHVKIFLTCEHASNRIPKNFQTLFDPHRRVRGPWGKKKIKEVLNDHWGLDLGAIDVATYLEKRLNVPLFTYPISRLFLEGNRYLQKSLFSVLTSSLPPEEKEGLIETYWLPHVERIQNMIQGMIQRNRSALHLGIHSFTPERNGVVRCCDIGILFNPKRPMEKQFAHRLQSELQSRLPNFRIRRNYPYAGYSEGLSLLFGKRFPDPHYLGIEIEINNKHIRKPTKEGEKIKAALLLAIQNLILIP